MKFRTPSEEMNQVRGILMLPIAAAYSGDFLTICAARKSPEVFPPSFP